MKLIKAHVTNFRSVEDSGIFDIGQLTCLVGKNEAGKTAVLHALRGLNPVDDFAYDVTRDYPRRYLSKYDERHPEGDAQVLSTWWELSGDDAAAVENHLGAQVLRGRVVHVRKHFKSGTTTWDVPMNESKVIEHLLSKHLLDATERSIAKGATSTVDLAKLLDAKTDRTAKQAAVLQAIKAYRKSNAHLAAIDILVARWPKFFYTSHFERMSGEISANQLAHDHQHNRVSVGDKIFLDFLEYAGTTLEELQSSTKHEDLIAQCEGASNDITDEIFQYWSQNEALAIKLELAQGRPGDPPPFNSGTIAKVRVENRNHRVTVPLSERSAGFVWFFSFLSQFKQLKKTTGRAVLLLDEPGLTLHGRAQADLLRYIEERLLPDHQVIYSTHSPFMVPVTRLADVRVVEDVVKEDDRKRKVVLGTKVSSEILSVDRDTLFPLQAQLGYDVTQTLFVGKNTLLVEGPSDVLFLHAISNALRRKGRIPLDSRWTVCPTGGLDKVLSFASLFAGNKLNIAVLCDYGQGDKSKVERVKQSEILRSNQVLTVADFTGKAESDVEDLFEPALYLRLVNASLGLTAAFELTEASVAVAAPHTVRLVKQVEAAAKLLPPSVSEFSHFLPADWLLKHPEQLDGDGADVGVTLDRFEEVFRKFNAML